MVNATRAVASVLGVVAGLIGAYHGYNETLQGSVAPSGLVINAIGPPCQGNSCLPAMTITPNFMIAGVLTIVVGLVIVVWSAGLGQRKNGGKTLILLSIILLLVGGGFLPPVIGVVAGAVGMRTKRRRAPPEKLPG